MRATWTFVFVGLVACARAGSVPGVDPDGGPGGADANSCPMSCDDQNACTADTCGADETCINTAMSCDDNDPCTTDTCDPVIGCQHALPTGSASFDFTGTMQTFVVPTCVTMVHVLAAGAQGGSAQIRVGGMGATLEGDFPVTPAASISILVGGQGGAYNPNPPASIYAQRGGTGGGGTFVVQGTTILVIAGAGGGASGNDGIGNAPGGPGQITAAGQPGGAPDNLAAGSNGGGGTTTSNPGGFHGGTGGGGYSGNGVGASNGNTSSYGTANQPGIAFVNGGAGGVAGSVGRVGGFGGGGAAGFTGGGGGGFSGGGAGPVSPTTHSGGGGGSINNGMNPVNVPGNRLGNGQVTITW